MKHKITGTQPEPAKTRIYGSTPVHPLGVSMVQPEALPHTKIYGNKMTPTVRVRLKGSGDDRELVVNETDFDPDRHELVDA